MKAKLKIAWTMLLLNAQAYLLTLATAILSQVLSFQSYLFGTPKNWAAHSGGIHPAMPVNHQEGETTDLAMKPNHPGKMAAKEDKNQYKYW